MVPFFSGQSTKRGGGKKKRFFFKFVAVLLTTKPRGWLKALVDCPLKTKTKIAAYMKMREKYKWIFPIKTFKMAGKNEFFNLKKKYNKYRKKD